MFKFTCIVALLLMCVLFGATPARAGAINAPSNYLKNRPATISGDQHWDDRFDIPGIDGTVFALAANGDELYIGGSFNRVGDVAARNIAKWDGQKWQALGPGVSGAVWSIVMHEDRIFAGGRLNAQYTGFIAEWDGQAWSELGTTNSCDGVCVRSMVMTGSDLYVAGEFANVGGVSAQNVARWDGEAWNALGDGVNTTLHAIAANGSDVYAGGPSGIWKWNGVEWSAGLRCGGWIRALAFLDGDLYIGGSYDYLGGFLSKWDGQTCTGISEHIGSGVTTLAVMGNHLLVGAEEEFYNRSFLLLFDGSSMSNIGQVSGWLYALATGADGIYAGGRFGSIDGVFTPNLARRLQDTWSNPVPDPKLGFPILSRISDLEIQSGAVYVGGGFNSAGNTPARGIAKWDGTGWTPLDAGFSHGVSALASGSHALYAVVSYPEDEEYDNDIYKWVDNRWHYVTSLIGVYDQITAITVFDDRLHVADRSSQTIKVWQGSSWKDIGTVVGRVNSFAAVGTTLYAGGDFSSVGGVTTPNLAGWNGTRWSSPGNVEGVVLTVVAQGSTLYVGGDFQRVAGIAAGNIARWDGKSWSAFGVGVNGRVKALAVQGETVYAGGKFKQAGGLAANNIARWRRNANNPAQGKWEPLGSGTNKAVTAIAVLGRQVLVSGNFSQAGSKPSYHFGIWHLAPEAPKLVAPPDGSSGNPKQVLLDWSDTEGTTQYTLQVREGSRKGAVVVKTNLSDSRFQTPKLKRNTKYVWRVQACAATAAGEYCSAWTPWWSFTVNP